MTIGNVHARVLWCVGVGLVGCVGVWGGGGGGGGEGWWELTATIA